VLVNFHVKRKSLFMHKNFYSDANALRLEFFVAFLTNRRDNDGFVSWTLECVICHLLGDLPKYVLVFWCFVPADWTKMCF
ncbi:hypothetical protein SERLA73DRAFT_132764, partial [Serpula lacrymans var. lacrymans S7.3]